MKRCENGGKRMEDDEYQFDTFIDFLKSTCEDVFVKKWKFKSVKLDVKHKRMMYIIVYLDEGHSIKQDMFFLNDITLQDYIHEALDDLKIIFNNLNKGKRKFPDEYFSALRDLEKELKFKLKS